MPLIRCLTCNLTLDKDGIGYANHLFHELEAIPDEPTGDIRTTLKAYPTTIDDAIQLLENRPLALTDGDLKAILKVILTTVKKIES